MDEEKQDNQGQEKGEAAEINLDDCFYIVGELWVILEVIITNTLVNKVSYGHMLHNITRNPPHSYKDVYYKGEPCTKIIFKDGDVVYSPTKIDKFIKIVGYKPINMYGKKTFAEQLNIEK